MEEARTRSKVRSQCTQQSIHAVATKEGHPNQSTVCTVDVHESVPLSTAATTTATATAQVGLVHFTGSHERGLGTCIAPLLTQTLLAHSKTETHRQEVEAPSQNSIECHTVHIAHIDIDDHTDTDQCDDSRSHDSDIGHTVQATTETEAKVAKAKAARSER